MDERWLFYWTDRAERAYVALRFRGGHWDVEWGAREKHGATGDRATGDHRTGDVDAAVALALARIAALSPEPEEAERVRPRLEAALAEQRERIRHLPRGGRRR
ncbi:MAG TPA: hypothetical protein VFC93_09395 [Chloroflexota bacterium]|nr:hypothetical protein [Chloroflexota bacterium]